jgi:hypothetical protein
MLTDLFCELALLIGKSTMSPGVLQILLVVVVGIDMLGDVGDTIQVVNTVVDSGSMIVL